MQKTKRRFRTPKLRIGDMVKDLKDFNAQMRCKSCRNAETCEYKKNDIKSMIKECKAI